ncbi:hypothetical protein FH974_00280 [Photobacterium ganghwense]|nr:hypothetical protein FH974_00280 [Photobacterium ganghwense]
MSLALKVVQSGRNYHYCRHCQCLSYSMNHRHSLKV